MENNVRTITERKRSRRSGLLILVVLAIAIPVVIAAGCTTDDDVPDLERRAQDLNKAVMCPVCPGESIDQSQNPLAVQMRGIVLDKLKQGWTSRKIKAFFEERYGPSVLMEPPREGFSLAVWILPPIAVIGASIALFAVMRMMRRPPAPGPRGAEATVQLTEEERDEYFRRIEAALDEEVVGGGKGDRSSRENVRPTDEERGMERTL